MTDTRGGEPAIAEVLTAINGLRANGPEPVGRCERTSSPSVTALNGLSMDCAGTWNSASDCLWTP
jgi:hypothetical protein